MINLTHDIKEIELILNHLAKGAYGEVAGLIAKIHSQAQPQAQALVAPVAETPVDTEQNVA